jgi:hypothetical protein
MPTFKNAILNLSDPLSAASQSYEATGTFLTAGGAETLILKSVQIANTSQIVSASGYQVNVNVDIYDTSAGVTGSFIKLGVIPPFASLDVSADNVVLEANDYIVVTITGSNPLTGSADFTPSVSVVGSYLIND